MEHALSETTGEAYDRLPRLLSTAASLIFVALCRYDHTNDLGLGGGPKLGAIGSREEDYVSLYSFLDKNFPGRYIKEWEAFDHPQLGAVEIGGLNSKCEPPRYRCRLGCILSIWVAFLSRQQRCCC